ncbi:lipopolysaccharide kinase InaA family protein [Halopseudomonas pachastrellae]|nr:lipopolysaccharide kinase InaA family protein [Halopseudomonas pachastrellae]
MTEELSGYVSLGHWYQRDASLTQRRAVLQQLACVLKRLHSGRRQHGCLYAKHIYVRVEGERAEVALLDLEKSRRRLLRGRAVVMTSNSSIAGREAGGATGGTCWPATHSLADGNGGSRHAA